MSRVVVVGGGVVGTGCAHFLRRAGHEVTVIEQGTIGGGCSHANCGFVCPSHVLPLAAPGAIGSTLKTLLQRNSPLKVKLRFDPALWSWFYNFARRCNTTDMLEAGHALQALLNSARTLYDDLFRTESLDAEWETRGLLFVFQTPKMMDHYAETDHLLREHFGLAATRHDGPALNALEPALKPGLAGGWHYMTDGHLRPDKLMDSWRRLLEQRGVVFKERCEFRGFVNVGRRVEGVETGQGQLPADAVVIATGAWTPLLSKQLGCRVPVQPGKGYSMTMARPARCPTIPMLFEEHRVAITPMHTGYRIGSTMEFAGYDTTLNRSRLELLRAGARHYLLEPEAEPVTEEWWGWRPMVFDGKPIIDRVPAFDDVLLATGHGMLGLSMATSTGKLVTELLDGEKPHVDPAPYAVARFG
jgi:D-amino-acid dehydrogenase